MAQPIGIIYEYEQKLHRIGGFNLKSNPYIKVFLKAFLITVAVGLAALAIILVCSVLGLFGGLDDIDIDSLSMDYSTQVCYIDSEGQEQLLTTLSSAQNRIWVDAEEIPQHLKDAIVSIEDERFYSHSGIDLKRTAKAFFVFVKNKVTGAPTTFGGSTITQQLVKNITNQRDRTAARKIKEISRAVNLEKKLSKDKILELYLNSIYLSQGCNGVQSASQKFFGKPVSELSLAECASIAGITQYPSLYDPLVNPEKNKEKQEIVLKKMLELGYISDEEYTTAVQEELVFTELDPDELTTGTINSYFVDHVINEVLDGLVEKGYTTTVASKMLYSGGLKIITTVDPSVQAAIEDVFENTDNFPYSTGDNPAQASMIVMDPYSGGIKGLVGGIGKKNGNLILNRATQTLRQPGSTIKPIAVYAPAFEEKIITPADIYTDKAVSYGGWTPRNYDHTYSGDVSVRTALRRSLNTIPVQILNELGPEHSFNVLTKKLGVTSLVRSETASNGKVFSDIGLSQLALGGLTHGISALELTAAYTPFANRGLYVTPHCYTAVYDSEGNEILSPDINITAAFGEDTAYITSMLLKEVVTSGTGGGAQLASGIFTAGKTGTTSDNHDRWFVGYTPHYVATVWYGYDTQQPIKASGNPCISVWRSVMSTINAGKSTAAPAAPSSVKYASYCTASGLLPSKDCPEDVISACWFASDNLPKKHCSLTHKSAEDDTPPEDEGNVTVDEAAPSESPEEAPSSEETDVEAAE